MTGKSPTTDAAPPTELIEHHTDALLYAAFGLGFPRADAEELVQDTFAAYLEARERFQGRSAVKTYLFGILYNKAREKRREQAREQANDPIDEVFENRFGAWGIWRTMPRGPEDEALSKEILAMIEDCAKALSVQQRLAFYLKEVDKETTENVCNILGVTATHVGVLLFRAKNKLRECLQKKVEKPK